MHPVAKAWRDPVKRAKRIAAIARGVRKALKDPEKRARHLEAVQRGGVTRTTPIEERFWRSVDKRGPRQGHMKTRCWVWTGTKQPLKQRKVEHRIYGLIAKGGDNGNMLVHRYAYRLQVGELVAGLQVQHRCDNPLCVRGSHLKQGAQADNSRDMVERDRPRGWYRTTNGDG
jgi:HNH endonuclease